MPRYLVTKYPCVDCAVPCEVRRTYEAKFVRCERCGEHMRTMSRIGWADQKVRKALDAAKNAKSMREWLGFALDAASVRAESARLCLLATSHARDVAEHRRLLGHAEQRFASARRILSKVEEHSAFQDLRVEVAGWKPTVIDGDGAIGELAPFKPRIVRSGVEQ